MKIRNPYLEFDVSVNFFCHRGNGPLIDSSMRVKLFNSFINLKFDIIQTFDYRVKDTNTTRTHVRLSHNYEVQNKEI